MSAPILTSALAEAWGMATGDRAAPTMAIAIMVFEISFFIAVF